MRWDLRCNLGQQSPSVMATKTLIETKANSSQTKQTTRCPPGPATGAGLRTESEVWPSSPRLLFEETQSGAPTAPLGRPLGAEVHFAGGSWWSPRKQELPDHSLRNPLASGAPWGGGKDSGLGSRPLCPQSVTLGSHQSPLG